MSTTETWYRSVRRRFTDPKRGPWHLRKPTNQFWNKTAVCGVYPTQDHDRSEGRPTEGKLCPKCLRAIDTGPAVSADTQDPT